MRKAIGVMFALAVMFAVSPAMALTVNYDVNPLAPGVQPTPLPSSSTDVNVSGSLANTYLDLWAGTGCANSCPFNSVRGGGSATYVVAPLGEFLTGLNMMWGTPDVSNITGTRNLIEFFLNGVSQGTLSGDVVATQVGLAGFITVLFSGVQFDSFVLTASQNAFEHAFSTNGYQDTPEVPLPASLLLLLSGLTGLGFMARSRVKTV
jgi:hypothetical protein